MPLGTPSNDFFGGRRPGANLFAESLVCLDANTGARKWHYQMVHHGLWDYDNPSPPNLVTIRVDGRTIDAVVQLTKQGYAFVFDRVTGKPVWPIEERPVPASDVDGEQAWPTQPVPTQAAGLLGAGRVARRRVRSHARVEGGGAERSCRNTGSVRCSRRQASAAPCSVPGSSAARTGAAARSTRRSGVLFFKTTNQANIARVGKTDRSSANPRASEVDADYTRVGDTNAEFMDGLPAAQAAVRPVWWRSI